MKRNNFPRQPTTFQKRFVSEENEEGYLNSIPCAKEQSCVRKRKVFVFRKTTLLPATKGPGKLIRRILVFDDHPDSLRLVLGRRAGSNIQFSEPQRGISSGIALLCILVVGLMIAMFWPVF
jgi:hypothetical protein